MVRRAFTLIELLIVVAIIAILAAIAVPNFLEAQTRSKLSRAKADMRTLALAIEAYAVDFNSHPLNGLVGVDGSIQDPQTSASVPPAHKFASHGLTTPVAYVTALCDDPFTLDDGGRPDSRTLWQLYFYTNLDWFAHLMAPCPPAVIAAKRDMYGPWILASAGPDGDRLDLATDTHYDATNGTLSNGDIVRAPRFNP